MADIFFHVPKCGGTSFGRFLEAEYGLYNVFNVHENIPNYSLTRQLQNARERQIRKSCRSVVKGHFTMRHKSVLQSDDNCFTIIRDPKNRLQSLYLWSQQTSTLPSSYVRQISQLDIESWLESGMATQSDNGLVRIFSGSTCDHGKLTTTDLENAITNVRLYFTFVAHQDDPDSIMRMCERMNWQSQPNSSRANATKKSGFTNDLTTRIPDRWVELDYEFANRVSALFESSSGHSAFALPQAKYPSKPTRVLAMLATRPRYVIRVAIGKLMLLCQRVYQR